MKIKYIIWPIMASLIFIVIYEISYLVSCTWLTKSYCEKFIFGWPFKEDDQRVTFIVTIILSLIAIYYGSRKKAIKNKSKPMPAIDKILEIKNIEQFNKFKNKNLENNEMQESDFLHCVNRLVSECHYLYILNFEIDYWEKWSKYDKSTPNDYEEEYSHCNEIIGSAVSRGTSLGLNCSLVRVFALQSSDVLKRKGLLERIVKSHKHTYSVFNKIITEKSLSMNCGIQKVKEFKHIVFFRSKYGVNFIIAKYTPSDKVVHSIQDSYDFFIEGSPEYVLIKKQSMGYFWGAKDIRDSMHKDIFLEIINLFSIDTPQLKTLIENVLENENILNHTAMMRILDTVDHYKTTQSTII